MFESLESRQMLAVSPVIAGAKIKGVNLSSGGISTNQTLITVPFTGNIAIADPSKIQLRGYAINPLSGKQKKIVVGVVKAEVLAADHSYLQITTDRLMRKGGSIIFYSGALQDTNGDLLAEQTVHTVKGQNKERFTLACRAFIPTNKNLFTPDLYSGVPTPTTASTTVTAAVVGPKLQAFLNAKAAAGTITQAQSDAAFARFSNATVMSQVPDANLRAAVLSLTGTVAAPAIGAILDGQNLTGKPWTILDFGTPPDPTIVTAQTFLNSKGRLATVIKSNFKGEDFRALSAVLTHEALHQDDPSSSSSQNDGLPEEYAGNIAETIVYGQQIVADGTFVTAGTALVNLENDKIYALIESGRGIFPFPGTLDAPSLKNTTAGIFSGGKAITGGSYSSWDNYIRRLYQARGAIDKTTAGNPTLQAYVNAITQTTTTASAFNDALLPQFDSLQRAIGTKEAVAIAGALKMTIA